jgi:hypothetical protein
VDKNPKLNPNRQKLVTKTNPGRIGADLWVGGSKKRVYMDIIVLFILISYTMSFYFFFE